MTALNLPELVLPWPSRDLHPNARVHWRRKAKAVKSARAEAHLLALAAGWRPGSVPDGRLHLWVDFVPPDRRRRDDDGIAASFKHARDGIADALGLDDHRFRMHPFLRDDETTPGGCVRVRITGGPEHDMTEMVRKGTAAWADTPGGWVDELRGGPD